ncbi:LOW QUALITY PROTEIN: E3 ubiquitin-protein ligase NEURL3 [Xyrichtys novacula]|uniref:LOW QUALITY PROTEIN: E3 ubiquitin-protein ligase NEURL3 n=1 Tax=Xyrichtys novacula TaxID=13765 RepID=A0AAV1G4R6_XYRNO|nr:LOW QUALITY PROTEIN: E3 ubiquitin-protein ligase NEURL3 [Xyrichtys novacula]
MRTRKRREENTDSLFKMMKCDNENLDIVETSHRCGYSCLGPLTFHSQAVGTKVSLSHDLRRATRVQNTFKNGLVFSNRAIKPMEKIHLRVEKDMLNWHGALRVGFTNIPPSSRSQPLPPLAIPNLTSTPGYWAAPVSESLCSRGSELEFWFSSGGSIYVSGSNNHKHKLTTGVDLRLPLWAVIDIYGNTCSISLLGSKKVTWAMTKTSCPAPECLNSSDKSQCGNSGETISFLKIGTQIGSSNSLESVPCADIQFELRRRKSDLDTFQGNGFTRTQAILSDYEKKTA